MIKQRLTLGGGLIAFVAIVFLLPAMLNAGSLEPSGPPAPTMRTLEEVQPTWSKKITCDVGNCPRFQVLADFNNEAVLDKETGLVWEKSPTANNNSWNDAMDYCYEKVVNNRRGWRLPTIEELASLIYYDPLLTPKLPEGHPFIGVQPDEYWSATTYADAFPAARSVSFYYGFVRDGGSGKASGFYAWCVRGGHGYDAY